MGKRIQSFIFPILKFFYSYNKGIWYNLFIPVNHLTIYHFLLIRNILEVLACLERNTMSTKELLLKEIEEIPELYFGQLLEIVQSFRKEKIKTFKGRPVLGPKDLAKMDCPLPPEPDYEEFWEEREKR